MVRSTTATDDVSTIEATVYHTTFDADDAAFETARDLRMGYDFATEEVGIDVDEAFDAAYAEAGTVDVAHEDDAFDPDSPHSPDDDRGRTERMASHVYKAWEGGTGHDPTETRSMSVGDIIVVDGDAWFVDNIGFVAVDLDGDGTDDEDGDRADRDDYFGMTYDPTPTDAEIARAFGVDDVDDITDDMLDDVDTDVPDALTDVVDLGDYATAHGAAKAAGRKIEAIAEEFGHDPSIEVTVEKRDGRDGDRWVVSYPAGDHDWAVRMTGGDEPYGGVITGFYRNDGWSVECGNAKTLEFWPR